jgi:hypothetical protein
MVCRRDDDIDSADVVNFLCAIRGAAPFGSPCVLALRGIKEE